MDDIAVEALFHKLLSCKSGNDLRAILQGIGDSDASTLDVPFGPHKLVWRAFGGTSSNISTINLGTKPGRSLTERITNAIDAVLEDRVVPGVVPPNSPRQAALQWFGRPLSGSDSGLFAWTNRPEGIDRRVHVVITSSDKESAPTIDVIDNGIGISAADFRSTILSLQGGNKIKKKYLIGAFGQGGAATLAFCEYAVIFSRSHAHPARLAFTVIRVLRLDESYKEDCYAYLTPGGEPITVFECDVGSSSLNLYPGDEAAKVPSFAHGTVVRHIRYRLTNLDKPLQASPGNLYHYLHYSVFDPLLPFRLVDLRKSPRNEYVGGSRNRLMSHAAAKASQKVDDEDDSNVQIKHFRPMEYVVPPSSTQASIGIEYWVIFAERKKKGDEYHLRSYSNELFVQQGFPIVGTLNGQNQGEHSAALIRALGLNLLSRHIVVHIDATQADSMTRRELFSSSREGFKDGPVLEYVLSMLRKILSEDGRLFELEKELTDRITNKEAESTKSEVKKEVSRLLKDAGLDVREEGWVDKEGKGDKDKVQRPPKPGPHHPDPLPTLPYPEVTKFSIVYPSDICLVRLGDSQSVIVETDADAAFDKQVAIRSVPPVLEVATRAPLRGGRVRWRLRPIAEATVGQTGEIVASITKPDGSQLTSSVLFEIGPAIEKESKKEKGWVPPFDILPVSPEEEAWNTLWADDGDDPKLQSRHAYKVLRSGGKVVVYYSTVFQPFKDALEKLKAAKPARAVAFETNYQVWIGYHAILQEQQEPAESSGLNDAMIESLQEEERQTVGQVQVKQSLKNAELLEAKAINAEPA